MKICDFDLHNTVVKNGPQLPLEKCTNARIRSMT